MRLKYFLTVLKVSSLLFQVLSAKGTGPERELLIILLVEEAVRVRRLLSLFLCPQRRGISKITNLLLFATEDKDYEEQFLGHQRW